MGDQIRDLQARGLRNPRRALRLIREAVAFNHLDLSRLTVFTEVGSRSYVTTLLIAVLGGAERVCAITRDSVHGTVSEVTALANAFATFCGVPGRVDVTTSKTADTIGKADIVTNLGFVRPIDRATVEMMKPRSVVALMCEAWEFRDGDLDLEACSEKGIAVVATNEDYPGLEVFDFSGPLCMKLLFDAEIEVYKSRLAIVSTDKFGVVIEKSLRRNGADVTRFESLSKPEVEGFLATADALIVADYCSLELFIGQGGQMEPERLRHVAPGIVVIPFAGRVDARALRRVGIWCLPRAGEEPMRMARTFAHLGVKPVVDLHCAGLKVAEVVLRRGSHDLGEKALNAALGSRGQPVLRGERADR